MSSTSSWPRWPHWSVTWVRSRPRWRRWRRARERRSSTRAGRPSPRRGSRAGSRRSSTCSGRQHRATLDGDDPARRRPAGAADRRHRRSGNRPVRRRAERGVGAHGAIVGGSARTRAAAPARPPARTGHDGPGALGLGPVDAGHRGRGRPDRAPHPGAVPPLRAGRPLGPRRRPALGETGFAPRRDPARPHPVARPASLPPHPGPSRPVPGACLVGGGRRPGGDRFRVHPIGGRRAPRLRSRPGREHRVRRVTVLHAPRRHRRGALPVVPGRTRGSSFRADRGRERHPQGHRAADLGGGPVGPGRIRLGSPRRGRTDRGRGNPDCPKRPPRRG